MSKESAPNQADAPGPLGDTLHSHRKRWLQLALVAVCAALEEVDCTDDALTEALFPALSAEAFPKTANASAVSLTPGS